MRTILFVFLAAPVFFALGALFTSLYYRGKASDMIARMNRMINSAIDGDFSENDFDESALSALETRLSRYLAKGMSSQKNILAEKEKIKELISDISHQTKTPLANILLYSQLLGEHELPEDCRECVRALGAQAEKLDFLIGALIKMSRMEAGIITVTPKRDKIGELLAEAAEQVVPKAEAKGITLIIADTAEMADFDRKWTAEAIFNLLDNAVKYSPEGGKIEIAVTPYELFCRIDIADEGPGIAEEEQGRIFSRFYRSREVSAQEGVGIGLYLAREILSEQGGYVKVQSRLRKGSVFSVFLPRGEQRRPE